jgi:hypothetical protein
MARIRLIGVSLMAVFAIFALTASVAAAEEKTKMLPEANVTFTGKGGEGKLQSTANTLEIKCKKGKGTGTIESANLGKYSTTFEECTSSLGGTCTGSGDTSGNITNSGTYHFWLALELKTGERRETLVGALVFLPTEKHLTCVVLGTNNLVLVKGCVAALAEPLNTLTEVTKDVFANNGTRGVQLITKVLPSGRTEEENCILLSSRDLTGEVFAQSALVGTAENEKFMVGAEKVTVLLMNPEGLP